VQGLQANRDFLGRRLEEDDLLRALEEAFELVYVTRTTLDQHYWILQLRRTLHRFGRLTDNAQYELVGYSSDEAEEPRVPVNIVRLLFDVPVSVDGASVWIRTRDPEASRHLFQSNQRFMTVLARCCRIVWQPETVQNMIAFYAPILETLESNFVDALTVDVASGARTEPPPMPAPPHQPVMEETIEEKLNKEINAPAIDILKAVGFTYEFTDLEELCRKLKLATFADFRAVTSDMISGAGLITKILERKLAQLCEQCADVEAYKRWRRRTLMFLAAPTDPPPLPAPPHQPGSSHAHISALLSRMQAV
jgi:hypothetical protein